MVAQNSGRREVDIYYSPNNPKDTILDLHASWNEMIILLAIEVGLLLLPALLWLLPKTSSRNVNISNPIV